MLVTDPLNPVSWAEVQQRKGVSVDTDWSAAMQTHTHVLTPIRTTFKYFG